MKNLINLFATALLLTTVACKKESTIFIPQKEYVRDTIVKIDSVVLQGTDVIYSDWLSPQAETTGNNGGGGGNSGGVNGTGTPATPTNVRYFTVNAPKITQEILDKGVVMAYCRLDNDNNQTRALATTTVVNGFLSIWDFSLSKGKIQFIQTSGNPAGIPAISSKHKFRYVIIPSVRHVRLSKPLAQMTYDEICEKYGIPK